MKLILLIHNPMYYSLFDKFLFLNSFWLSRKSTKNKYQNIFVSYCHFNAKIKKSKTRYLFILIIFCIVSLTQTKSKGKEHKEELVGNVRDSCQAYSTIMIISYLNMRTNLLKNMRIDLKDSRYIFILLIY